MEVIAKGGIRHSICILEWQIWNISVYSSQQDKGSCVPLEHAAASFVERSCDHNFLPFLGCLPSGIFCQDLPSKYFLSCSLLWSLLCLQVSYFSRSSTDFRKNPGDNWQPTEIMISPSISDKLILRIYSFLLDWVQDTCSRHIQHRSSGEKVVLWRYPSFSVYVVCFFLFKKIVAVMDFRNHVVWSPQICSGQKYFSVKV